MSIPKAEVNTIIVALDVVPCYFSHVANVHKASITGLSLVPLQRMGGFTL